MAELLKSNLKAKLAGVDPELAAETIQHLMDEGHTFVDEAPDTMSAEQWNNQPFLGKLQGAFTGQKVTGLPEPVEPSMMDNPLFAGMAAMGKKINKADKALTGFIAEKTGQYLPEPIALAATVPLAAHRGAVEAIFPEEKEGAAMSFLGGLKPSTNALSTAGPAKTKVIRPGKLEEAGGELLAATSRVPPRFSKAVVADPTILEDATPNLKTVSKEMGAYFKSKGAKINSEKMGELFDQDYVPSDNQVSKLNGMVDQVLEKIKNNLPVSDEELVFAERAANGLKRSTGAQTNKYLMSKANGAQSVFTDQLEKQGFGELKELKAKYFRALAKDAFQDWLPQNKTGGPNALSTLILGSKGSEAIGHALEGNYGKAVGSALQGSLFSPKLVGKGIQAVQPKASEKAVRGGMLSMAALNSMLKKKENERPKL